MDDKKSSNVQHPLHAVLMIFHATVRTAFETTAAFWRPWFREPKKKMLPQDSTLRSPSADKARAGSDGEKAQGADKARATAKDINARSEDGEKAQGADKAIVER